MAIASERDLMRPYRHQVVCDIPGQRIHRFKPDNQPWELMGRLKALQVLIPDIDFSMASKVVKAEVLAGLPAELVDYDDDRLLSQFSLPYYTHLRPNSPILASLGTLDADHHVNGVVNILGRAQIQPDFEPAFYKACGLE